MSHAIAMGAGWVTPLGRELDVLTRATSGELRAHPQPMDNPTGGAPLPCLSPPADCLSDVAAAPRLRRSSRISLHAVAAAQDAAARAGLTVDQLARAALVFAVSDGGVAYTRRFFADVVRAGPGAGSPLLFPETVYNASASHIAAGLGLNGEVLTLVGDAAVALDALAVAGEILAAGEADHCLVAAAQELDWITGEAYRRWRLAGSGPPHRAIFGEGAAAIVLARDGGGPHLCLPAASSPEPDRPTARLEWLLDALPANPDVIISGASGSRADDTESAVLRRRFPGTPRHDPRRTLGESLAASALQQVVFAAAGIAAGTWATALVTTIGFEDRAGAVFLTREATGV